jgi:hypothetical protein
MLGENTSNKQPLIPSIKSGPHLVTISNVSKLRDNLGELKLYKGNIGVVIKFTSDQIEHEELYWLHGRNYSKLLKVLRCINYTGDSIVAKDVIGKKLWLVFRHNVIISAGEEESRTAEIIEYSNEDKKPNYPDFIEEYDIAADETNTEFPEPNF